MKIAIVHTYCAQPGEERQHFTTIIRDRALGSLLSASHHQVDVRGFGCTASSAGAVIDGDDFLPWTYAPLDAGEGAKPWRLRVSSALVGAVTDWQPDVLVVKGAGTPNGDRLAAAHNGPLVIILAGKHRGPSFARADLVLTESAEQDAYFARCLGADRVVRLPKLVNPVFFATPRPSRTEYDIAVVSAFTPWKNHLALVSLREHPVSLVLPGEGPVRAEVERRLSGSAAQISMPGVLPAADIARVLARSRILVHPSRSEGFPRAVAEGMASGLPVVCVRGVVGAPVVDGYNGLLVNEQDLVPATLELLCDEGLLATMAANALSTARREFSIAALRAVALTFADKAQLACDHDGRAGGRRRRRQVLRARVLDSPGKAKTLVRAGVHRLRSGRGNGGS